MRCRFEPSLKRCSEDLPSGVSSEGGGVVVKIPPPLEDQDGGWVLAMGSRHLAFREGRVVCRGPQRTQMHTYHGTLGFVLSVHSPVR
jgi:hypothetical protein